PTHIKNATRAKSLLNALLYAWTFKPRFYAKPYFETMTFMCFDAPKSGLDSQRLVTETTWNKPRRRKRICNTKKHF
ncbi:hypothetical protein, partial [Vibrio parahaemolyticus]|uniref:hypothetical protein n=1 Tax=Vibrio parahaemolyticus TaxID=670 RepID=UPI001C5EA133